MLFKIMIANIIKLQKALGEIAKVSATVALRIYQTNN
jgi:hypothetical protein